MGGMNVKKMIAIALLLGISASLLGCAPQPEAEASVPQQTAAVVQAPTEQLAQATTEPTTKPTEEQTQTNLFLKVSVITFSVVGEQEDIYLGLAPREDVRWESDNPEIVSVELGVLTANGVGTTTIRASYGDQVVTCTASCLARDSQELESLGFDILSQPKHVIPQVDMTSPCTYFDDAALVGDSISYMMMRCENKGDYLGDLTFMTRGGTSLNGFVKRAKNIAYRGVTMNLEDAIAQSQVKRVYMMIGSNDIASPPQEAAYMDNWTIMLERIREKSPDVEVVIISNIPQYADEANCHGETFLAYNRKIQEYNEKLRQFAKENGCLFLDLHYYIQDHCGRTPKAYNLDGYHLNDEGYDNWMKMMRYYAQYELEGGTLS